MNLEITGKLVVKYDVQVFGEKQFKTREFILELFEEGGNGNTYTNYAKMQFTQAKCEILDRFNPGDTVKVNFNVRGRSYVDKKDGSTKYISNMEAWRMESTGQQQTQQPAQHQYASAPQQQTQHTPPNFSKQPEPIDDLPF